MAVILPVKSCSINVPTDIRCIRCMDFNIIYIWIVDDGGPEVDIYIILI